MIAQEVIKQLKTLGQEPVKKVLLKHGIVEPLYGVRIGDMEPMRKQIKKDHQLSLELYDSGIYDARYFAGLIAEPEKMTVEEIQHWLKGANAPILFETIVAGVAAESAHGLQLALEWIDAKQEGMVSAGWATLVHLVSIKEDKYLDVKLLKSLLDKVVRTINDNPNRVRYNMNSFIIAAGSYVKELNADAKAAARKIGRVEVDMGDTACKIPDAVSYIEKVESRNAVGKKRKSAIC